jgi:hypothetical protein
MEILAVLNIPESIIFSRFPVRLIILLLSINPNNSIKRELNEMCGVRSSQIFLKRETKRCYKSRIKLMKEIISFLHCEEKYTNVKRQI